MQKLTSKEILSDQIKKRHNYRISKKELLGASHLKDLIASFISLKKAKVPFYIIV